MVLFWPLLNEFLNQQSVQYQTHDVNIQFLHHHFGVKIVIDSNTVQVQYNVTMSGEWRVHQACATTGIIFYSPRNMNLSADSPNLFSGPESKAAAFLVFLLGGDLRMFSVPATALVWMWKLFRPASNPSNLTRGQSEFLFCLTISALELPMKICEDFTIAQSRTQPLLGPSPGLWNLREPSLEALISLPLEPRLLGVKVSYFPLPNSLWTQNVQRGV